MLDRPLIGEMFGARRALIGMLHLEGAPVGCGAASYAIGGVGPEALLTATPAAALERFARWC